MDKPGESRHCAELAVQAQEALAAAVLLDRVQDGLEHVGAHPGLDVHGVEGTVLKHTVGRADDQGVERGQMDDRPAVLVHGHQAAA